MGLVFALAGRDDGNRLWREELRETLTLAWPLVLTNFTQALIPATDVVLLGWAGKDKLAAASLGVNLVNGCMIFGVGVVMASAPMIARAIGHRQRSLHETRRTVRQSLWAAVTLIIPVWLLLWHTEAILLLFHQDPLLAHQAAQLVRPMMFGILPLLWYVVLRSFISALSRPGWALATGLLAVLFNAMTNYLLIFGGLGIPALGLFGAGLGSALSNFLLFLGLAVVVSRQRHFRRYHLFGHFWRPDWARFRDIWRLGAPIGVTLGMEVTVFSAAVFLMGLIGAAELAAHAVAITLAALCFMTPLGIGQAATVRVGLAYGRGDPAGIARAGGTAFGVTMAFMLTTTTVMLLFPRQLIGLFMNLGDPANAHVAALALSFLMVAALFQLFDGAQAVGAGMLRGLHDTAVPMAFSALGYIGVGLGSSILFGFHFHWGGVGIWTGLALGLAATASLLISRWALRKRLGLV
jgi:MATE family multidrug resistance protein